MEPTIEINGEFHNINEIIGEIITKEKYRFVDKQIINSVIEDVFRILLQEKGVWYSPQEYQQAENRTDRSNVIHVCSGVFKDKISEEHKKEAAVLRDMVRVGKKNAVFCAKHGYTEKESLWKNWTHYKELEAEYHESQT